jgi:hypothetical protein
MIQTKERRSIASRRTFLKTSAAALTVPATSPIFGWQGVLGWDPVARKSKAL